MTAKKDAAALTAPTPTKPAKSAVSNLTLGNADDALRLAAELQKFVKANKLTSTIQGKEFPNVEAWQFAGSLLGLSPMLEKIDDKSTAEEIKWHATVAIQNVLTGAIVGRGFATCSNKEHTKRSFADYAICSMAQTRAVGKAYRLSLGWLMKAAGYEATPAEEMQDVGTSATVVESPAKPAAGNAPADSASASPATPAMSVLSEDDEQVLAGYRDAFEAATSTLQVQALWAELNGRQKQHLLADKDAAKARVNKQVQGAASTPVPRPGGTVPAKVPTITNPKQPTADAQGQPIPWATAEQKDEIMGLIQDPLITRPEKAEHIKQILKYTEAAATDVITQIKKLIEDRKNTPAVAA